MGTLVLPKIHSVRDLNYVSRTVRNMNRSCTALRIVASIESARSVIGLGDIASWKSEFGAEKGGELTALLASPLRHSGPQNSNGQATSLPQRIVCPTAFSLEIPMRDSSLQTALIRP